jgi:hypothetical protein
MIQLIPSSLPSFIIGQAASSWMTTWLTPIWFLAAGIAMGLLALALFVVLFRALSYVSPWERLSHSMAGHAVAAGITVALTAGVWTLAAPMFTRYSSEQENWLLAIALSLLCSIFGWAIVFCPSKQAARGSLATLGEGAAGYLGVSALVIVLIGAAAWGVGLAMSTPIVADPLKAFASIPQLFSTGEVTVTRVIPAASQDQDAPFVAVELPIDFELLNSLTVTSDKSVVLGDSDDTAAFSRTPIRLLAGESLSWNRSQKMEELPVPYEEGTQLHVQNSEIYDANLQFQYITAPPVPEAASFLITAIAVVAIGLSILLQQAVAPRASAVAHATVKNELAQPLFMVLMLLGVVAILLYEFLSFNTFGEDIKLLKDCGITTIMLLAAFQGIWSASSSISEEIEGKTALTVLSKPIQRRSFVIGKFLGIFWVLFLMFVILGSVELGAVAYKPIYDAREASETMPTWQDCHLEMFRTIPGCCLGNASAPVG